MKINLTHKNMPLVKIVGTVAGIAIGGLIGFTASKFINKKYLTLPEKSKNFEKQKEKVLNMIETAREKFNEKVNYPVKANVKSMIHNKNHLVKSHTKPINR
jgi:gas vesicle protein